MDWFARLTGFSEVAYAETRARLAVEEGRLLSTVNGGSWRVGTLTLPSLADLRERAGAARPRGRLRVTNLSADVRALHREAEFAGALFQVASQFNLLEMTSPHVTPEHGVTRYEHDLTQGPACAIAAGAATIWRNYFVPVEGEAGQTRHRQIDTLSGLGARLAHAVGRPRSELWVMKNGYAQCSAAGLAAIEAHLAGASDEARDVLCGRLCIGLASDVEVTDGAAPAGTLVSQAFTSALPVAYGHHPPAAWEAFARLVLEATFEATLCAAILNAARGASDIVLLTRVGGGAFGNADDWIDAAMARALALAADTALDVRIVSFGEPPPAMLALERRYG